MRLLSFAFLFANAGAFITSPIKAVKDFTNRTATLKNIQMVVPITLISSVAVAVHYHDPNAITPQSLLLQAMIGFYTYGKDRLSDADAPTTSPEKQERNDFILRYKDQYFEPLLKTVYQLSMVSILDNYATTAPHLDLFTAIVAFIVYEIVKMFALSKTDAAIFAALVLVLELAEKQSAHLLPFLVALDTTCLYIPLKKYGPFWAKSVYVAAMWTASTLVLPCAIHDGNYAGVFSPQGIREIAVLFLLMFGSTNLADIKDKAEDAANGVKTLPTAIGEASTGVISILSIAAAFAIAIA